MSPWNLEDIYWMWQKPHARKSAQGRSARGPILPKSNRNFRQPPNMFYMYFACGTWVGHPSVSRGDLHATSPKRFSKLHVSPMDHRRAIWEKYFLLKPLLESAGYHWMRHAQNMRFLTVGFDLIIVEIENVLFFCFSGFFRIKAVTFFFG